jgi:hypothetical protein
LHAQPQSGPRARQPLTVEAPAWQIAVMATMADLDELALAMPQAEKTV